MNVEKNLIITVSIDGTVCSYNVDHMPQADNSFSLLMVDKAGIDEFTMEKKIVEKENVDEKYVKIALSKVLN